MPRRRAAGFILPSAILLVILLLVSGMSFMQLDFLERRMVMNEADNHGAFYLASAGLERGLQSFRPPADLNWTPVLNGSQAEYPAESATDPFYDPRLCPDLTRGCAIPLFQAAAANPGVIPVNGHPVMDPDALIAGLWPKVPGADIWYTVRAFNNGGAGDAGTTDGDGQIMLRALATVRGDQKLLEATVAASSNLGLINCQGDPGDECPDSINRNATLEHIAGREPRTSSELPAFDPAFYKDPANFPWTTATFTCGAGIDCGANPIEIDVQSGGFYLIDGLASPSSSLVIVNSLNMQNIAVFSQADVQIQGNDALTTAVITSEGDVQLQGNITLTAPLSPVMYPAVVSGGNVGADRSVLVIGNIYAAGVIDFRPIEVHGLLVGTDVQLQGASTYITDEGNPAFYGFMPGFFYPDEYRISRITGQSWRELE